MTTRSNVRRRAITATLCVPILLAIAVIGQAQTETSNFEARIDTSVTQRHLLNATRVVGNIHIDGQLDEPAWRTAEVVTAFTESYPNPGIPASERTEARIIYDGAAIYVGIRMYESQPDSVAAPLARRDAQGIFSDWVHVLIDSYHDRRTAFRFSVNPRGVQQDAFHYDDSREDGDWDAVWRVVTRVDSVGWVAEFRIPLSQLRFHKHSGATKQVWGVQIMRDIARRNQRFSWAPWTPNDGGFVSRFGELHGLSGIRPVRRLQVQPYASVALTRAPGNANNPFYNSNDIGRATGADLKVGLTSGLTLTGSITPDFGQVEVDPSVVNLTAFETFFPEKRPFFVEDMDIFRFGNVRTFTRPYFQQLFYSRRIGREPQRYVYGDDILYVNAPEQTTILGAAKISGKTGPWSVGLMNTLTRQERADYVTKHGEQLTTPVEPRTNYFAGRIRREIHQGGTIVGGVLTTTNRDMRDAVFANLLHSRAHLGGLDFEHTWGSRAWTVGGYLAGSQVHGSEAAIRATQRAPSRYYQRPDAAYVELDSTRTSLTGHMAEVAVQRSGNWDFSLNYKETSPGFEINDLGFQGRTDYRHVGVFFGRRVIQQRRNLHGYYLSAYNLHGWNFGGDYIQSSFGVDGGASFSNLWSLGFGVGFQPERYDDRLTRGGPLARVPSRWSASSGVSSDTRKQLSLGGDLRASGDGLGGSSHSVGVSLNYRPSSALRLRFGPQFSSLRSAEQFVRIQTDPLAEATFGRRYVFADIDRTTVSMETRLDWTFLPTLSLQLYAQPFVASGDYERFKEFRTPNTYDFDVYGEDKGRIRRESLSQGGGVYTVDPDGVGSAPTFSFNDPDFNVRSLSGNAVLRWEYRPGSTLFFVWQQQRRGFEPIGTFHFARDYAEIFNAPATNVFLIKATYWFGS
jgi:hypothetical protein